MRLRQLATPPLLLGLLLSTFAACGGSTTPGGLGASGSGSGTVSGTVAGTTVNVASAVAINGTSTSSSCINTCVTNVTKQIAVLLSNRSDITCTAIQNDIATNTSFEYANLNYLVLSVGVANGDVIPGTYNITGEDGATGAQATVETFTSTCATGVNVSATGGTVTLTQVTTGAVAGTYTATFGAQGTFSGSFDAAICAYDAGVYSTPPKQVCQP